MRGRPLAHGRAATRASWRSGGICATCQEGGDGGREATSACRDWGESWGADCVVYGNVGRHGTPWCVDMHMNAARGCCLRADVNVCDDTLTGWSMHAVQGTRLRCQDCWIMPCAVHSRDSVSSALATGAALLTDLMPQAILQAPVHSMECASARRIAHELAQGVERDTTPLGKAGPHSPSSPLHITAIHIFAVSLCPLSNRPQ